MHKNKTLLQFSTMLHLWQYAQRIQATFMEINTRNLTLLCDCSEQDLSLLSQFEGKVLTEETATFSLPPDKRIVIQEGQSPA